MQAGVLNVIWRNRLLSLDLYTYVHADSPGHSWFVCTFVCEEHKTYRNTVIRFALALQMDDEIQYIEQDSTWCCKSNWPRLYQTSISPLKVRTSMIVWPRKSSDSRLNFCFTRDLMSSSSSHTRTLMRSEELWHSLHRQKRRVSHSY